MQRHHLLPRQLLGDPAFARLFAAIGCEAIGYHDFRANGLLLPCEDRAAVRFGLPLHRGPHHGYSAMVRERVGGIEARWSRHRRAEPRAAREAATARLQLLQGALRRRLLDRHRPPLVLARVPARRPLAPPEADFTELDAMAEALWNASAPA